MFGWLRFTKPLMMDPDTRAFDPEEDLDVESVLFGTAPPSPAHLPLEAATQSPSNAFQQVRELDPEEKDIIMQAARQAQQEILTQMKAKGVEWSEEVQHNMMLARAVEIRGQLLMFKNMVDDLAYEHEKTREEFADMSDKIVSMKQRTSLDQIGDFWQRHPFLVGFLGAGFVHDIKKQLGQR